MFVGISDFKEKEFAIFCGAGISKSSGLPLAKELKQSILERLPIDKKDIDEVMNSNLPFEAFMEILSENTNISKIIDIFKDGEPNANHILMARLAQKGYLKTIFTTNFDLLIERALENEGLKKDKDFEVYVQEEQFARIDSKNIQNEIIKIFKIHGSVDNVESIRTTMKAVASRSLSDKRTNVIKYLFSTGSHGKVLILGYSCSDEFDITRQIQSIERNLKEIIFIDHVEHSLEEKEEIEDIKIKNYKNPFKKFIGKRIICHTDKFVEILWNNFSEIIGEKPKGINYEVDWEKCVDEWAKELEDHIKYKLTSEIFYKPKLLKFRE